MLLPIGILCLCVFCYGLLRLIKGLTVGRAFGERRMNDSVTAEMHREMSAVLKAKFQPVDCQITEKQCADQPEKLARTINLNVDDVEAATETILRDLLKWFNQSGLSCGEYLVHYTGGEEAVDSFRKSFVDVVKRNPRVMEMEKMGARVMLASSKP